MNDVSDYAGSAEYIKPAEQIESGTAKNRPCHTAVLNEDSCLLIIIIT